MGGLAVTFPVEYKSVYEDDTSWLTWGDRNFSILSILNSRGEP